jgi:outer membrane protein OmpA-like peptidoglycan-associated protein
MRTRMLIGALAVIAAPLVLSPVDAEAQIPRKLKDAAKNALESEAQMQVDRLVREAIRCAINDPACYSDAQAGDGEVIFTDDNGEIIVDDDGYPITDREEAAEQAGVDLAAEEAEATEELARPGEGVWANYDFVPGETVLYYEDYENDRVGDFPRRMEFMSGNWEIVEWEGRRLLRNLGPRGAALKILLPRELPERFTIEFEAHFPHGNQRLVVGTATPPGGGGWGRYEDNFFQIGVAHGTGVERRGQGGVRSSNTTPEVGEGLVPIRIMVDGSYAKVYANERRVANIPNAVLPRSSEIYMENIYFADADNPMYVGPVRVAEGGLDLYEELAADGRVATQGILFAFNSSAIKPESTPTLDEIGTMLQDHGDLRIRIEGHTDSTGEDEYNQTLSDERAAAVRQFLIDEYGIDASRLEAQGFGESSPVDTNDTPEGQQNNRRVELVRLDN